jgi:tRNA/rRNA methyltransferase
LARDTLNDVAWLARSACALLESSVAFAYQARNAAARQNPMTDDPQMPTAQPVDQVPPVFVLVRPQMGENIGGAARAMLNFGLERLRVVDPRDGWPSPKAVAMASGAGRLLDHAGPFADVRAAVADCDFVFATTARGRELTKPIMTPERAMDYARALVAEGKKVGVLFGPERAGLENEDLVYANALVTVPVNPDFPSLNLAQCVLLMGYEWKRQKADVPPEVMELARTEFASHIEVQKLGDHFEERLEEAGFFYPPAKVPGMKQSLRSMWGRLGLTRAEVQTFHGMLRQIVRNLKG